MIIAVAGPYSADTEEQRKKNLIVLNTAAARLLELGHVPVIGVNAALPVLEQAHVEDTYKAIMDISMAAISDCDAILVLAESRGTLMERDFLMAKDKPVFYSIGEIEERFKT